MERLTQIGVTCMDNSEKKTKELIRKLRVLVSVTESSMPYSPAGEINFMQIRALISRIEKEL